ncbi:aldehyde dehydrogenase family protein [Microbacterium awajiense]|uniref:Aldehyde dehydrogenase family protein n=1 Tax=Microbacterium awajiense TaxID=415214 RepID=A0ABP7AMW6_9MICO
MSTTSISNAARERTFAVVDPRTGTEISRRPAFTDADVVAAIDRAHSAYRSWRDTDIADRAEVLHRIADLQAANARELRRLLIHEMGAPPESIGWDFDFDVSMYRWYADHGAELLADEPIDVADGRGMVVKRPLGVILGIIPWNAHVMLTTRFAAPNLIVGNTVLVKPPPQCPESAALMEQLVHAAGVPEGVYTALYSTHEQTEMIIADPRVHAVSFTGSAAGGAAVAEIAGRHLTRVSLELGGSDPFVVLSTDDLAGTVADAVDLRLLVGGQACICAKRFILMDDLYDEFVRLYLEQVRIAGTPDPSVPDDATWTLSSDLAAERLQDQVDRAVAQGATLVGGERAGNIFAPGLLVDVPDDADVHSEELFGPIAIAYRVHDDDEAVEIANGSPYGLGAYVYASEPGRAEAVAERIDSGMCFINRGPDLDAAVCFGGVKASGFGRAHGRWGAEEFLNHRFVRTR